MILKGNQRGGGRHMALHLLNAEANEHVNVHEVSGFMANDVLGAFNEIHAVSISDSDCPRSSTGR